MTVTLDTQTEILAEVEKRKAQGEEKKKVSEVEWTDWNGFGPVSALTDRCVSH
jgi:hypothetical protein